MPFDRPEGSGREDVFALLPRLIVQILFPCTEYSSAPAASAGNCIARGETPGIKQKSLPLRTRAVRAKGTGEETAVGGS